MSGRPQIMPATSGIRDGAQDSTTPLVGCAQAITLRPPAGGSPGGMKIAADTWIGSPFKPVEPHIMRKASAPPDPPPVSGQTLIIAPGLSASASWLKPTPRQRANRALAATLNSVRFCAFSAPDMDGARS
jgi:hypothetical protein